MFPYYKNFIEISPKEIFDNFDKIKMIEQRKKYHLHSFYPKFKLFSKNLFRGQYLVLAAEKNISYEDADVLSDFYMEELRIEARRNDNDLSLKEMWETEAEWRKEIISKVDKKPKETFLKRLRQEIKYNFAEVQNFSIVKGYNILKEVLGEETFGKKWLDISAGWGDRLIVAIKCGMIYHSCDPNKKLKKGHNKIIKDFVKDPNLRKNYVIDYIPFQDKIITEKYDVVFSSPPYFDLEIYDSDEGQSVNTFPNFEQWITKFLFRSLSKAWDSLNEGGYLILHLGDNKKINMCEATNLFIQSHLANSSFHGVIGLSGQSGYPRPVWVWQKMPFRSSILMDFKTLIKDNEFSLEDKYPKIFNLIDL